MDIPYQVIQVDVGKQYSRKYKLKMKLVSLKGSIRVCSWKKQNHLFNCGDLPHYHNMLVKPKETVDICEPIVVIKLLTSQSN